MGTNAGEDLPRMSGISGGQLPPAHRLLHLVSADAAGADAQILRPAVPERPHALKVGVPYPLGQVVSVAHAVTGHGPLAADVTTLSQGSPPRRTSASAGPRARRRTAAQKGLGDYPLRRRL